jgi:hypothetical protein
MDPSRPQRRGAPRRPTRFAIVVDGSTDVVDAAREAIAPLRAAGWVCQAHEVEALAQRIDAFAVVLTRPCHDELADALLRSRFHARVISVSAVLPSVASIRSAVELALERAEASN